MGNENKTDSTTRKHSHRGAWISGICLIVSAIIGTVSININFEKNVLAENNEELKSENTDLSYQFIALQEKYNDLENRYFDLQDNFVSLENDMSQYLHLFEENTSLKTEISKLQNELQTLNNMSPIPSNTNTNSDEGIIDRVSIFDLDTFQGTMSWYGLSNKYNEDFFTDIYGNPYFTSHAGRHYPSYSAENYDTPVYFLDNNYTTCKGQMVWSKIDKNRKGSTWLEFYSEDKLIYSTELISATDEIQNFEFSVENVETLKIVFKTTVSNGIYVIYPYFELEKKVN